MNKERNKLLDFFETFVAILWVIFFWIIPPVAVIIIIVMYICDSPFLMGVG